MSLPTNVDGFFVIGGALRPNASSYVRRPADDQLLKLTLAGEYCNVLTSRQMGKTSLRVKVSEQLHTYGVKTVNIDLGSIGTKATDITASEWYFGLVTRFIKQLELQISAETWWQENSEKSIVQRFSDFLRDIVLNEVHDPIVVFADELDLTLDLEFTDDFFAVIRAMYNARVDDSAYRHLTFVLLGVARPADLIKERTHTPYNIGTSIDLADLSFDEAEKVFVPVLERIHPRQGSDILRWIMQWTSGQPYLTQKLCANVADEKIGGISRDDINRLVNIGFLTEKGREETHLLHMQDRLLSYPRTRELLGLYKRIYQNKTIPDDGQSIPQNQLKLSGIIKVENQHLRVRNNIYRSVFDLTWIRKYAGTNWARIVAVVMTIIAATAIGVLAYDSWLAVKVEHAQNRVLFSPDPREKVSSLAEIFRAQSIAASTNFRYVAQQTFYFLEPDKRQAFFDDYSYPENSTDLVVVVEGLYTTLADVDNSNSSRPLLESMLRVLPNTKDTSSLRHEIQFWLDARDYVAESRDTDALEEYNKAVDEATTRNMRNQAVLYERAKVLIRLKEYDRALHDLEQVTAIAKSAPVPTPTALASSQTASPLSSLIFTSTPATLVMPTHSSTAPVSAPSTTETISPIDTVAPLSTPLPVSFTPQFSNLLEMISAVRKLIEDNPELFNALSVASESDYPNLREYVPVSTPTATSTLVKTSTSTATPISSPTATLTASATPTLRQTPRPDNSSTPTPTTLPPIPTRSPTRIIITPLVPTSFPSPQLGEIGIINCNVIFRWTWPGILAEDEWFAVRIGKEIPHSVVYVKSLEYTHALLDFEGEYRWQIAICKGDPGSEHCARQDGTELAASEIKTFQFRTPACAPL